MSSLLHRSRQFVKRRFLSRLYPHYCPICETQLKFKSFGTPARAEVLCPQCGSLERHRITWLFLLRHTDLLDGKPKTLLHIAPEPAFERLLRSVPGLNYVSMDLQSSRAMTHMDITNMAFRRASFDVVYCSHVLEHIPDDAAAMRECRRVLRDDGWALFLVPIGAVPTREDPTVVDPNERMRLFGQDDHVRVYGPDFEQRLKRNGFSVRRFAPSEILRPSDGDIGVPLTESPLYLCRPATAMASRA